MVRRLKYGRIKQCLYKVTAFEDYSGYHKQILCRDLTTAIRVAKHWAKPLYEDYEAYGLKIRGHKHHGKIPRVNNFLWKEKDGFYGVIIEVVEVY